MKDKIKEYVGKERKLGVEKRKEKGRFETSEKTRGKEGIGRRLERKWRSKEELEEGKDRGEKTLEEGKKRSREKRQQ